MEEKMQFFKECPACGNKLGGQEDKCPCCGFEGLNTVFLSQEDYLIWQETVLNPYKETIKPPRIYAGHSGVLILMFNGNLYGYGNNDSDRFGQENYGIILTKPQLIAKNVKSAALGYNYAIYLTNEGTVEFLGKSNIPLRERFQGIQDADEVYASGSEDIFWVKYKNGELGVWGKNTKGEITEVTKLPLGEYEQIVKEYDSYSEWEKDIDIYYGFCNSSKARSRIVEKTHNLRISPTEEEIENEIKKTDEFRRYVAKYSEANIIFEFKKEKDLSKKSETIERETRQTRNDVICTIKSGDVLYKVHMYFQNNYLYHPIAVQEDAYYEPELVKSGSGLINCDDLDRWGWLYGVKIEYFCSDYSKFIARLLEDGKLEVVEYKQGGGICAVYEGVADVSVSASDAYILTQDRILYRLLLLDFINAKKLSEAERIDY